MILIYFNLSTFWLNKLKKGKPHSLLLICWLNWLDNVFILDRTLKNIHKKIILKNKLFFRKLNIPFFWNIRFFWPGQLEHQEVELIAKYIFSFSSSLFLFTKLREESREEIKISRQINARKFTSKKNSALSHKAEKFIPPLEDNVSLFQGKED